MPAARRTSPPPVSLATRVLYEAMHRFDGAVADSLGIHRSDLRCLNALELGALAPGVIATRLGLTSGSVTALVDRLVRAGLVERHADASDRRSSTIALTAQAYARVDQQFAKLGRAIGTRLRTYPADERARIAAAIHQLATAFDDATAAATTDNRLLLRTEDREDERERRGTTNGRLLRREDGEGQRGQRGTAVQADRARSTGMKHMRSRTDDDQS